MCMLNEPTTNIHTYVQMNVKAYVQSTYMCTYLRECAYCVHTYTDTYVHTYVCQGIETKVPTCVHTCAYILHTYVDDICMHIHRCVHTVQVYVYTYICMTMYNCTYICKQVGWMYNCTCPRADTNICMYAHMYVRACMHMYMHVCICTHMRVLMA